MELDRERLCWQFWVCRSAYVWVEWCQLWCRVESQLRSGQSCPCDDFLSLPGLASDVDLRAH